MKKNGKKLKTAATAAVTAAGVAAGSLFGSPGEIIGGLPADQIVTSSEDAGTEEDTDDESSEEFAAAENSGIAAYLRKRLLGLPFYVRAGIILPLWIAGCILINAAGFILELIPVPVIKLIAGFLLTAAVLLGILPVAARFAFPDMPVKKILSRGNIRFTVISLFCLYVFIKAGSEISENILRFRTVIMFAGGIMITGIIMIKLWWEDRHALAVG